MADENPTIGIRFTPKELALLDALMAAEERSRSDVVRRAVRAYAEKVGVDTPGDPKPAAQRPKR